MYRKNSPNVLTRRLGVSLYLTYLYNIYVLCMSYKTYIAAVEKTECRFMSLYIICSLVFSGLIAQRCSYKPLRLLPAPTSVPSPGAGGHAGGPGDLL